MTVPDDLNDSGTSEVHIEDRNGRTEAEFEEVMLMFETCLRRAYDIAEAIGVKEAAMARFEQMVQDLKRD